MFNDETKLKDVINDGAVPSWSDEISQLTTQKAQKIKEMLNKAVADIENLNAKAADIENGAENLAGKKAGNFAENGRL